MTVAVAVGDGVGVRVGVAIGGGVLVGPGVGVCRGVGVWRCFVSTFLTRPNNDTETTGLLALLAIVSVPRCDPLGLAVKATLITHPWPAANCPTQELDGTNSALDEVTVEIVIG
ncbi:MAG TPA: hypothetical protein VMV13_10210 [Candidatus Binataceae bacterium]|nr:hypothetical protein [Candidatus Binataceae bacterium]